MDKSARDNVRNGPVIVAIFLAGMVLGGVVGASIVRTAPGYSNVEIAMRSDLPALPAEAKRESWVDSGMCTVDEAPPADPKLLRRMGCESGMCVYESLVHDNLFFYRDGMTSHMVIAPRKKDAPQQ